MIPVVNDKYKYILLYSAKSGCTSLRLLYLDVHGDELSKSQLLALDDYHNLNEVHAFDPEADYSDYFSYAITRNPYSRIVSAFLDQYVFFRNEGVRAMLGHCPPIAEAPNNFVEFLEYLKRVPDHLRDSHFQSQAYFEYADTVVTPASLRYRLLKQKPEHAFGVDYVGDISGFNKHTTNLFKRVFKRDSDKFEFACARLNELKKRNSSFYSKDDYPDAATLNVAELDSMVFAPKLQDFYRDARVRELVAEIYQSDFVLFDYPIDEVPQRPASAEIDALPDDLDWQMYLRLNPDLSSDEIYNERSVVRHYLEFGRFEEIPRAYKIEAPSGFNWQRYLSLNQDLIEHGLVSEEAVIEHYISYGIREGRLS